MATESRTIQAYLEIEMIEEIEKLALSEKRSFSNMVAVLLEEAIKLRLEDES